MNRPFPRLRGTVRILLILGMLALGSAPARAKSKKSVKSATPAPTAANGKKDFEVPIPINHDAKGVRIPIYGPDGLLQMMFESEIAFRVDAQQLRLTQLKIQTYDATGNPEMNIDMPKSFFDLKTRVFSSVDPVTIHRTDFEVIGSNMTFDTETRIGKFTGPVRMLVFNLNEEKSAHHE